VFDSELAAVGDEPFVHSALQQLDCMRTAFLSMVRGRFSSIDEVLFQGFCFNPRVVKMKNPSDNQKQRAQALLPKRFVISSRNAAAPPSSENALMLSLFLSSKRIKTLCKT
jgi:hypothetical protein